MNCEVLAIGTELLLGPNVDTNSTWIGERLAAHGIDSFFHTVVGDNHGRIVDVLRLGLSRSDAVIVTGGLGPTQDDLTREAIAEVMGVELIEDASLLERIEAMFVARKRPMSKNNAVQAQVPHGALAIEQRLGTAPGLICPVGSKVIYALPGVPHEMQEMVERSVLPDLVRRSDVQGVIASRFVRTWGTSESMLAEMVAQRLEALDELGNPTLAFLAQGLEGIAIRITAKAADIAGATALLDNEEAELRAILGSLVFGIDGQTLEAAVGELLLSHGLTLGVAESVTGGLLASRLTNTSGASLWFKGGVVSYATEVKQQLLGVPEGPVINPQTAMAMARGVCAAVGADIGIGLTGVAGPNAQEGAPVGLVFAALALPDDVNEIVELRLPGDRQRIREYACVNVLDALRKQLMHL